jgi:TolB protein
MKRLFLLIVLLTLWTGGQVSASCRTGEIEIGDSCQATFEDREDPHLYSFEGEAGDVVSVTVTWEGDAEVEIRLAGPGDADDDDFELDEETDSGESPLSLEGIELPEDGTYHLFIEFDDDADYDFTLAEGEGGGQTEVDVAELFDGTAFLLAITSTDVFNFQLHWFNADGLTELTDTGNSSNYCGSIAPDGSGILFPSNRDEEATEIYLMEPDGDNVERLTDSGESEIWPQLSADGERIVYTYYEIGADAEIYVMDADGDNVEQLTDNNFDDRFPGWSPDGEQIVFSSSRTGNFEIYIMDADGDNIEQLTSRGREANVPRFSPDGERILFHAGSFEAGFQIFVMDADGENLEQLTDFDDLTAEYAAWSPDGEHIAFNVHPIDRYLPEVWVMNADGSNQQQVLAGPETIYGLCDWGIFED